MDIEIKYFGILAEKLGKTTERVSIEQFITDQLNLHHSFEIQYPILKSLTFNVAVDGVICNELPTHGALVLALLPPFAGG